MVRISDYRSRGRGSDFRRRRIFGEVAGLEPGQFSLVRIIEELLGRKSSGSSVKTRD
jgi:hypothetical protein